MDDLFESPKALLTWAYEDTQRFKELEGRFFDSEPYETIVEFDPEFERDAHRIRFVDSPPSEMRKLASHIVNDLRHSLDQAFYAAATHFGWRPTKNQKVIYFPWVMSPSELEGRLRSIPEQIHEVTRKAEPYPAQDGGSGGNNVVRQLGFLGGPNKHEVALSSRAACALTGMSVNWNADWRIPYNPWDPFKEELTIGYFPKGTKGDYDAELTFLISFRDVEALKAHAASDVFDYWGAYAQHVVKALEGRVVEDLTA